MAVRHGVPLTGLAILCLAIGWVLVAWPFAGVPRWLTVIAIGQMAGAIWLIAGRLPRLYRCIMIIAAVTATAFSIQRLNLSVRSLEMIFSGICHAAAYTGLLCWFVTSLRSGREPVVTGLARRVRQTMPPEVVRYTRHVTMAWCGFFAGQLLISLGLLIVAPVSVWAAFVVAWNLPLLAAMTLAEFACRSVRFRRHQRTGMVATLAAVRNLRGLPGSPS